MSGQREAADFNNHLAAVDKRANTLRFLVDRASMWGEERLCGPLLGGPAVRIGEIAAVCAGGECLFAVMSDAEANRWCAHRSAQSKKTVTSVTALGKALRESLRIVAEWSARLKGRLIMNTKETNEIREITAEEIDLVSGGSAGDVVVANLLIAIAAAQESARKKGY